MSSLLPRRSGLAALAPAALALAVCAWAAPAASAQVTFATFNSGDVSAIGTFSGSGGGIGVGPTEGADGAPAAALSIGINPADVGGFAGVVLPSPGPSTVVDVSATAYLTLSVRPTTVQAANVPLTLEINLQEATGAGGVFNGAVDDEFQAEYRLLPGAGYRFVQIPLASFTDDNSVFAGSNDGFDFARLHQIVIAVGQPAGPEFAFAIDEVVFRTQATGLAGPVTELNFFDTGDVSAVGVFSATGGGIGVGPTTDAQGVADRALNMGLDPVGAGGFAGVVVPWRTGVADVSGAEYLTFQIRPTVQAANLPLTLEVNFQEDTDGNGVFDGAVDDEFQARYRLTGTAPYTNVAIPLASFVDDNSVFVGANNGLDLSRLLQIVLVVGQPAGPELTLSFDQFGFSGGVPVSSEALPPSFASALAAYPNPTAGAATLAFELAAASHVRADVVDLLGRRVATLADGPQSAGPVRLGVPGGTLAPGVYLVRVATDAGVLTTRVTVAR